MVNLIKLILSTIPIECIKKIYRDKVATVQK